MPTTAKACKKGQDYSHPKEAKPHVRGILTGAPPASSRQMACLYAMLVLCVAARIETGLGRQGARVPSNHVHLDSWWRKHVDWSSMRPEWQILMLHRERYAIIRVI